MGGADGISEMTRQWVRVLQPRIGRDVDSLEVWSLDDAQPPAVMTPPVRFRTAHGGRLRFGSFAAADGVASAAGTIVIVISHTQGMAERLDGRRIYMHQGRIERIEGP